mgnify:CR=1 FL=1
MTTESQVAEPSHTTRGTARAVPLYFGPHDRPLFGWFHPPKEEKARLRVLLCPPLGYEGLFAHPTLKLLAEALADHGMAVLRFDLDGTGDSAGSGADPQRVESWIESIVAADEESRRMAGDLPLAIVGMRAGALLAVEASRRLEGVDCLVLWAPVTRGRAFMREQKAFASMAVATAATSEQSPAVEGGIEAYGYFFSDETSEDLGGLDLRKYPQPPATRTLVLWRDDVEDRRSDLKHWAGRDDVQEGEATGYAAMMEPPISMETPRKALDTVCGFVQGSAATHPPAGPRVPAEFRTEARVAPGVIERVVWYDPGQDLFGVLTLPEGKEARRLLVLLNNAAGYRVGPHSLNPPLARHLAEHGIATFRVDLGGVGDSRLPPGRDAHHVYGLDSIDDVRHAVDFARTQGLRDIYLGGLCSGAFLAWHAALTLEGIAGLSLWNLQLFEWNENISLDVSPLDLQYETNHYRKSLKSGSSWKKLFSGQVNVRYVLGVAFRFVGYQATSQLQRLRSSVGFLSSRTEIGTALRQLHGSGTRVHFIFADRDPGLANLRSEVAGEWKRLLRNERMHVAIVEGSDHSFTPGWASRALHDLVKESLEV